MRRPIAIVATAVLAGCTFRVGERLDSYPPAQRPEGVRVSVAVRQTGGVTGELLEASDTALVLLSRDNELLVVPLEAVARVAYGAQSWAPRAGPEARRPPARLRLLSRYPQGITPELLQRLLDALGQARPVLVGRSAGAATAAGADRPHATAGALADPAVIARFLEAARGATARYADQAAAIAAGYRRLGPEFPAMGEHWIHPGLMVSGIVDAAQPQVLCYATIAGRPTLVSLAFAVPLAPDELPPVEPIGRAVWHDHAERVDEEVLLLVHPQSHRQAVPGFRLAMFHAWTGIDNPDGTFAQNNWRLPFVKLGIDPPDNTPSTAAAQALALLSAADDYYPQLFDAAAVLEPAESRAIDSILAEHRARVARWADRLEGALDGEDRTGSRRAGSRDIAQLEAVWTSLWSSVRDVVGDRTWHALAILRGAEHQRSGR